MKRSLSASLPIAKRRNTSPLSYEQRQRIAQNAIAASALARSRGWVPGVSRTSMAWVRSLPGSGETKFNDTSFFLATLGAGGAQLLSLSGAVIGPSLNLIPQGTTDNTRIGNKIILQNIRIRGQLSLNSTIVGGARFRVTLILDSQANGANPSINDVFTDNTIDAFMNMDNTQRFKVIKDKFYTINAKFGQPGIDTGVTLMHFKMNHKAHKRIDYSSTTGAIGEVRSNNYFIVINGTDPTEMSFSGKARVTFKDN